MPDQPLQPFSPPTELFKQLHISGAPSAGLIVEWALYLVFFFWAIYTMVAIYHWLKYSHASWIAFPAITLHLFISFALITFTLTGTRII